MVATITAFSYLELVTKYPGASGAALYTHKAFGIHFMTFLVTFAVLCSGLTSAATASSAVASELAQDSGRRGRAAVPRRGEDRVDASAEQRAHPLPFYHSAATAALEAGSSRAAQNLNSGIFPNGSSWGAISWRGWKS